MVDQFIYRRKWLDGALPKSVSPAGFCFVRIYFTRKPIISSSVKSVSALC